MKPFLLVALVAVSACTADTGPSASNVAVRTGAQWVAFCSNRSGAWAIWIIHPDGTALTQVSRPGKGEQDVDPSWSPDRASILFTSTRGGNAAVWRMAEDGGKPERLCEGDQAQWSPDGREIVFRRGGALMIRDLASQAERSIAPKDWNTCSGPAWSPDGKMIAFARLDDGANAIYVVPVDGGAPTKVYGKQGACKPNWSPDGRRLVYETETHLCTINPDGKRNRLLTTFGGVQRFGRFGPDGRNVIFCQAASPQDPWEIYVIPAAGGEPVRLTEGGSDMYPDWR